MKRFAVGVAMLSVFLVGCGNNGETIDDAQQVEVESIEKVNVDGEYDTQIFTVVLEDGTKCVVSDGNRSGGIDCDWSSK